MVIVGGLGATGVLGCPDSPSLSSTFVAPSEDDRSRTATQAEPEHYEDSRFIQIRDLLREDPNAPTRAIRLYALVEPICSEPATREDFLRAAAWSASFSDKKYRMTVVYALDTLEHVATTCARNHLEGALDLLEKAGRILPNESRVFVIEARILAAQGRFEPAEKAALRAKELGHVHAIALLAHIQARRAREQGIGYRPGMLDAAIETVMVEPTADWALIDLEAVLATRARLLLERAVWEPSDQAKVTEAMAEETLHRLAVAPFEKNARRFALDTLCFFRIRRGDDPEGICRRAAEDMHHLGAARAVGLPLVPKSYEVERYQGLEKVHEILSSIGREDAVIVVFRGDEFEILEWVRPAVRVLERLAESSARTVVVDRSSSARASALVNRIVELAGLDPWLRLAVGKDTLAMPCVTAVVANRRTPRACTLDRPSLERLGRLPTPRLSLLVGRDLDAEIDDLKLYELPAVLLSFRQSRFEKTLLGWLKSQTDVFVVTPPSSKTTSSWLETTHP